MCVSVCFLEVRKGEELVIWAAPIFFWLECRECFLCLINDILSRLNV